VLTGSEKTKDVGKKGSNNSGRRQTESKEIRKTSTGNLGAVLPLKSSYRSRKELGKCSAKKGRGKEAVVVKNHRATDNK